MPNLIDVEYQHTGKSLAINNMGMREMQAKAFEARASRYLLIKAPPAAGKSRALMFLALDKLYNQGIKKVIVSVPERAILELLAEVGAEQGLEESRNIMEGLRSVRVDVLGTLLKHCPRVKVVRLCLSLAEELNLHWAAEVRKLVGSRGRGRWSTKLPDGTSLILKP